MKRFHARLTFSWIGIVAVVLLVVAHVGGILLLRHKPVASVAGGIVLLLVINHLGVFAPVHAFFRRRTGK